MFPTNSAGQVDDQLHDRFEELNVPRHGIAVGVHGRGLERVLGGKLGLDLGPDDAGLDVHERVAEFPGLERIGQSTFRGRRKERGQDFRRNQVRHRDRPLGFQVRERHAGGGRTRACRRVGRTVTSTVFPDRSISR